MSFLCKCAGSLDPVFSYILDDYDRVTDEQKSVYDMFLRWYRSTYMRNLMIAEIIEMIDTLYPSNNAINLLNLLTRRIHSYPMKPFDWNDVLTDYEITDGESIFCSICQEECKGTVKKTVCNHIFHEDCIQKWGEKGKSTCPTCRNECKRDP